MKLTGMLFLVIEAISLSFSISALCALIVSYIGQRISLIDIPSERSSHFFPIPRGGGIGIWIAVMLIAGFELHAGDAFLFFALFAIGLLGLFEDRFSISSRLRLLIQLVLSALVVMSTLQSTMEPYVAPLLFLFWTLFVTGTTNFYNFMDGINGMAGLSGVVVFGLTTAFAHFNGAAPDIVFLGAAVSCACLGFLPFNFPKAKVFMGDVGSLLLGFAFASFMVKLSVSIDAFLCLIMFLCTFYADALLTLYYRWREGDNLMQAHRKHLYQYMCNELKMPHWKVSLMYAAVQLIFGLLALTVYRLGVYWQITLLCVFGVFFFVTYRWIKGFNKITALSVH